MTQQTNSTSADLHRLLLRGGASLTALGADSTSAIRLTASECEAFPIAIEYGSDSPQTLRPSAPPCLLVNWWQFLTVHLCSTVGKSIIIN